MKISRFSILSVAYGMLLPALLASCAPRIPEAYTDAETETAITPDYTRLTIPCNIAPLNFRIDTVADNYTVHFYSGNDPEGFAIDGRTTDIPADRWHKLTGGATGDSVFADIYVEHSGRWTRFPKAMRNAVADSIDPYISYRLIEPSYISFETMAICQRELGSFDEKEIFNSQALSTEKEGQCMNCHSYQDYNREGNMQMHFRVREGGTLVSHGGQLKKVNLKTGSTVSSGVYPSWHPTEALIAYSVNTTTQSFHTNDRNKVEVQDAASEIILYDVKTDRISHISHQQNDSSRLATFPYWHPDGKGLWYAEATVPPMTKRAMALYQNTNFEDFRYDILYRPFDIATHSFGSPDTIFAASEFGMSATFPRPSPDGRYLLFTMGRFGTFHIWHRDSDLYIKDLSTGETRPMDEINSNDVESYHSWSSNGRWIIFSSRRDDGSYTRLYIAYFGRDGKAHKPFRLPQQSPDHDTERMKSYNIPEFMVCPVEISKRQIIETVQSDPINATEQ